MGITIGTVHDLNRLSSEVSNFLAVHWGKDIALKIPSYYQWQFVDTPTHGGRDRCIVAIDDDTGALCGVMGINERPFIIAGQEVNGVELTTWIIDPAYLGLGIGVKIISWIQQRYDLVFGMGVSEMAMPIYLRHNFRFARAIPRFLRVYNLDALAPYAECSRLAPKMVAHWQEVDHPEFEYSTATSASISAIQQAMQSRANFPTREPEYLDWRYTNHPIFHYQQYVVSDPGGSGPGCYLCLRVEDALEDLRLLHVVDCFGPPESIPAALAFIEHFCQQNNVDAADFYSMSSDLNRFFLVGGWFSMIDDDVIKFPHLFHPVELRSPPTTSLIYWSKDAMRELAHFGELHITKGDADFDRPTGVTYRQKQQEAGQC